MRRIRLVGLHRQDVGNVKMSWESAKLGREEMVLANI